MAKNQMTTEYVVPGSKELSFEANPAAALQCLVGGLLPAQPPTGSGLGSKGRKLETDAAPIHQKDSRQILSSTSVASETVLIRGGSLPGD